MKKVLLTLMFVNFLITHAQNPVQEFNFNGTLNSSDNTISFLGTSNFVNDRMGVVKGAQRLVNKSLQGVVGELAQDNKPRSISVWIKFNSITATNYILGYGTAVNSQFFGLVQQPVSSGKSDISLVGWGDTNNVIANVSLVKDVWYQYCVTYDGITSKIYRNGELLKSAEGITRLTKGYILRLGAINATVGINADIDDLKIYNVAMTDEQVMQSYTTSKPSVVETVPVVNSLPKAIASVNKNNSKPVVAGATVSSEEKPVSKTVEVFSQGRKIVGSNASNIGDLPEGTYLIKVTKTPSKK